MELGIIRIDKHKEKVSLSIQNRKLLQYKEVLFPNVLYTEDQLYLSFMRKDCSNSVIAFVDPVTLNV